jgi:dTDP-4-dehydrorhamnose reductase
MTSDGRRKTEDGRGVLLLGGSGLLGTALRAGAPADVTLLAPAHGALDATDPDAVARVLDAERPAWIVNCVAYTLADAAESDVARAELLNATLPARLAALAAARGIRLLHVSTDYVFDGAANRPYRETDAPAPLSVYGRTKAAGDAAVLASGAQALIVRGGWMFGPGGRCFPRLMFERARAGTPSRVVADQVGGPTSTYDLAQWMWALMARDVTGLVHASNAGECSWADVAERAYAAAGRPGLVTRVTSAAYGAAAARPRYSVLDASRLEQLLGITRRPWDVALDEYLGALARAEAA